MEFLGLLLFVAAFAVIAYLIVGFVDLIFWVFDLIKIPFQELWREYRKRKGER